MTLSRHSIVMNLLFTFLFSCVILWLGLALFAALLADRLIFPAPSASYEFESPYFHLHTSAGHLLPALYFAHSDSAPVLLYSHGNGEDLGHIRPLLEEFNRRGWNVLAYEYPGYGVAPGPAGEQSCYQAIDAAYAWLIEQQGFTPAQIFLYGRSLGSGPSIDLASRKPAAGLILDGAYLSTFKVLTRVKLLWWDRFANDAKLPLLSIPLLSIHGKKDRIVPFWHGRKLYQLAQGPKHLFWPKHAGHNNLIEITGEDYWDSIEDFRSRYFITNKRQTGNPSFTPNHSA